MAQKLRDDKIGTLQHSAGNIQMLASLSSPAYLTIGGQQYKITSTLVVALPAMTANTRYQVFAVQSGGVVSLVISQNENSVGPAGYTRWKLVGSVQSNYLGVFGDFVKIKGLPSFSPINSGPLIITGTSVNPTQVGNTKAIDRMLLSRKGSKAQIRFEFVQTAVGSNTAGTGDYLFQLPTNILMNPNLVTFFTTIIGLNTTFSPRNHIGTCTIRVVNSMAASGGVYAYDTSKVRIAGINVNSTFTRGGFSAGCSSGFALNNTDVAYSATFEVDIDGWSDTAIEDL